MSSAFIAAIACCCALGDAAVEDFAAALDLEPAFFGDPEALLALPSGRAVALAGYSNMKRNRPSMYWIKQRQRNR